MTQATTTQPSDPSQALQHYQERCGHAITAAGLRALLVSALTAAPVDTVAIPSLFRSAKDPLVTFLNDPPALRHAAFDMRVRNDPAVERSAATDWVTPGLGRVVDINALRALAPPSLAPRSQAVRPARRSPA